MKCEKCGNIIEDKYIWCPVCGEKKQKKQDVNNKKIEKINNQNDIRETDTKNYKKIIIIILLMTLASILTFYREYKEGYDLCIENHYIWPVSCTDSTSFAEYFLNFNIIKAITSGYINLSSLLFSRYIYILLV